jgi:hypothetical protein
MKAFQVRLNGTKLCVAGLSEQGVLTAIVDYVSGYGRDELALSVGGLISSKEEHVRWVERRALQTGDEIQLKVIETESADRPKERHRRDPAAERKQQKRYVREMAKKFGWTITTARSRRASGKRPSSYR